MQKKYILSLDAGTVKNRAVLFDKHGDIVSYAEKKIAVYAPQPGWIEQDADEIWSTQRWTAREAIRLAEEHAGAIDLMISDIGMPGMNGRQLADEARRYPD